MPPPPGKGPDEGPPGPEGHEGPPRKEMSGGVSWREYERLKPEQIGELLASFGEELVETGQIEVDGVTIEPAIPSYFEGRLERGPGGETRLVFELEWSERNSDEENPGHTELYRRISHDGSADADSHDLEEADRE